MLSQLLNRQATTEAGLAEAQSQSQSQECTPPPVCHDFQTARLFLSHFGLLNLDEDPKDVSPNSGLLALDSSANDFCKDLWALDAMSPRTSDTVHIFYVKSQQTSAQEILANATNETNLSPYFLEFIRSLGWPVNVQKHPGWTGDAATSYKIEESGGGVDLNSTRYDGQEQILYWADACSEIAFVIPSRLKPVDGSLDQGSFNASSLSCKFLYIFFVFLGKKDITFELWISIPCMKSRIFLDKWRVKSTVSIRQSIIML